MSTRKHVYEEIFDAEVETVFAILHTPERHPEVVGIGKYLESQA